MQLWKTIDIYNCKMNHAMLRSVRTHPPRPSVVFLSTSQVGRKTTSKVIIFRQVTTMAGKPENQQTSRDEASAKPNEKSGDVMSHSFGEGYATRSDEEGFGGIYEDTQSMRNKKIHENHPAYDKTQGSEVKEKEKVRFQTNPDS